jgi:carbon storage regulator CsrA
MLVLSRKRDEKLTLTVPPSDQPTIIEVTVVEVQKSKVRLGMQAPKEVAIARNELSTGGRLIKTG